MSDDRRPSARELDDLIERVRREPNSPAFVDLMEAYLQLGRPSEAIAVGATGLIAAPDHVPARIAIARAQLALHQWKDAQGELLRVVKVDRESRVGFALLGEVLVRRSDFERAIPVLQHAQTLDPGNQHVAMLLSTARASQQLPPPPPIPTPIEPSRAAPPPIRPAPPPVRPTPPPVRAPRDVDPTILPPVPAQDAMRETSPPTNPRPAGKPQHASRSSAAVDANYLNSLLVGGQHQAGARAASVAAYDVKPDRKWGHSTVVTFVVLFFVMFAGMAGAGAWWWWSNKQRDEAVARLQKESQQQLATGSFAGLEASIGSLRVALAKQNDNPLTFAYVAEATGLESLLYGTEGDRVHRAADAAKRDIKLATAPGYREIVIGQAAAQLASLSSSEAPATAVTDVMRDVQAFLADHPADPWGLWLMARAQLAAGQRTAAHTALRAAGKAPGLTVAIIDEADLLVDEGAVSDALKLYEQVLAADKTHPLALVGRALARAENGVDTTAAVDDLSVKLDKPLGPRVTGYRYLALALAQYAQEDYPKSNESLAAAVGVSEPRFLARVALAQILKGDLAAAAKAREGIRWYSKTKPEDDPTVVSVDVGLLLAAGTPNKALALASKIEGVRARLFRAQALMDLEKPKDAMIDAEAARTLAPDNIEAQIMREFTRVVGTSGDERTAAIAALDTLASKAKTKLGRHALGIAQLRIGDTKEAKKQLLLALDGITPETPNPMAYRTHTALAEVLLGENDVDGAAKELEAATKANSGYLPALALRAKLVLVKGDPDKALELLAPILKEPDAATSSVEFTEAEALATKKDPTPDEKVNATDIITRLKAKDYSATELGRVAFMIDPALPATLELPLPPGAKAPPAKKVAKPAKKIAKPSRKKGR